MASVLDRYVPQADVTDDHSRIVEAPAEVVYDVVQEFDLDEIPLVHGLFWLRSKVLRSGAYQAEPGGLIETTKRLGWGVLEEEKGRRIVVGAVTQPWLANPQFRAVAPERFLDFAEPGLVKIAWTFETEPEGFDRTRLRTQTRAYATDEVARKKFRAYWRKFGAGVHLIRIVGLPAIRREAERRYKRGVPPRGGVARPG